MADGFFGRLVGLIFGRRARSPVVKLGGVTCLGSSAAQWAIRAGVEPVIQSFDVRPQDLPRLLATIPQRRPVDLTISAAGQTRTFKGLFVIREDPASGPKIKRVIVADRRIFWPFTWILVRANIRRRSGAVRRGRWNEELQQQPAAVFQYAQFSLPTPGGEPFTPRQLLERTLDELGEKNRRIDGDVEALRKLPVEELRLDDPGHRALGRVLALFAGAEVTLEPDGSLRVFSRVSGREVPIVGTGEIGVGGAAGPEIVGAGHVELVDRNALIPEKVRALFTIESEVRFDFIQDEEDPTIVLENPQRIADNVGPNADFNLRVDGVDFPTGVYLTIGQYIKAWRQAADGTGSLIVLTPQIINRAFIPELGLWQALDLIGEIDLAGDKANWAGRVAMLQQHYRQTFRINPQWMDRILVLKDYLVATIDITQGQRSPARAFADHAYKPSRKGIYLTIRQNGGVVKDIPYSYNVIGFPRGPISEEDTRPAPADVQILDSDQGIVRVGYKTDAYGKREQIWPSQIVLAASRNMRPSQKLASITYDSITGENGGVPQLSPDQRVAILLTAVPASPNSKKQLYPIEVDVEEAKKVLPPAARRGLKHVVKGLVREVRVGAGIETARVAWNDDRANDIERIFGVNGELDDPRAELRGLVVNDEEQAAIGDRAASLPNIARAVAATVYAEQHGRVYGARATSYNPGLRLEGALRELLHQILPDGRAITQLQLVADGPTLEMFAFLDPHTRQIILKQIKPQG